VGDWHCRRLQSFDWLLVVPSEDSSPVPPSIPDYQLLSLIGRGSYGDVWLGRGATGLFRAIKVVWRDKFEDPEPYEREFRGLSDFMLHTQGETRQMALLHVGRNEEVGFFYYVMELADDAITGNEIDPDCYAPLTLKVRRDQSAFLPAAEVLSIGIDLTAGLAELHATGLVHRDIKPSNVIIVNGRPKLADIGQVSATHDPGSIVGTEGFIPPEGPGTPAADIFSLGKVLYELAMGEDRQNFPSLPANLEEREDRADLLELNEIIVKACAPLASARHADAQALWDELKLLQAGKSVQRLRFAERGLSRARRWGLVALAVAVIAGIGAGIERNRANVEAAGRAEAEAELANLTRRTLYDASIASAQRALETENFGVAREALARARPRPGEPDLRGFEWHVLWRESQGDPAEIIRESGDTVTRLEPSPDGRWMAIDNTSPQIDLHDLNTGEFVKSIAGVHRVAGFSPDGSRIVGSTPDYQLETWSIAGGTPDSVPNKVGINRPLKVHPERPLLLFFEDAPNDQPHTLGLWNFATGKVERSWPIPNREGQNHWVFHEASPSRDLQTVLLAMTTGFGAGGGLRQHIRLIDMSTGESIAERESNVYNTPMAMSPDAGNFAISNPQLALGTVPYLTSDLRNTNHASVAQQIGFDRTGNRLLAPVYGNKLVEITVAPHMSVREFRGSESQLNVAVHDVAGDYVWSADRNGQVRRWPRAVQQAMVTTVDFGGSDGRQVMQVGFSADSSQLFAYDGAGMLRTWQMVGLTEGWSHPGVRAVVDFTATSCWVLSAAGQILELSSVDGSRQGMSALSRIHPAIRSIATSPGQNYWLVESGDDHLVLWDAHAEAVVHVTERSSLVLDHQQLTDYALTDEGVVISVDTHPRLMLWDATNGSIISEKADLSRPGRVQISPDQKMVSLSGGNESARILRLPDFALVGEFPGSRTNGVDVTFHPTEPIVATQVLRGSIALVNYQTRQQATPLVFRSDPANPRSGQVGNIAFSPDGKSLVAVDVPGLIRVWRRD